MFTLSSRNRDVQSNLWRRARISKKQPRSSRQWLQIWRGAVLPVDAEVQVGMENLDRLRATSSWSWSPDWNVSMVDIHLRKLLWVFLFLLDMPEWKEMTDQTDWQNNPLKCLASRKIWSVEELETLPAGTKPRTPHHRGGERRVSK